jgi:hypothetical protein
MALMLRSTVAQEVMARMIWGQVNLGNVSKAGKPPKKQSKNSV